MKLNPVFILLWTLLFVFNAKCEVLFEDDFESYSIDDQLACVNPDNWQTWSNEPCGDEDPFIVFNQSKEVNITGINDLLYTIPNYTSGYYIIEFDLLIPTGCDGYFNVLQEYEGANSTWGMQVYFGHTNIGEGNLDAGAALAQEFSFEYDTWLNIKVEVDLNNDWAMFLLDDVLIHEWVWTEATFGMGLLQLGGVNFFAWDGGVYFNPDFMLDDFSLTQDNFFYPCNPPTSVTATVNNQNQIELSWGQPLPGGGIILGYNIFQNGEYIAYVETGNSYFIEQPYSPGFYEFCVSTVCDYGESQLVCDSVIVPGDYLLPPQNLTGPEMIWWMEPFEITWDPPGVNSWIQWDAGLNDGNGVGLTSGGTFNVSSHWLPEDLQSFVGMSLTAVSFFPFEDLNAIFTIKVWIGDEGQYEVISQPVPDFIVNEWNEIILEEPVYIYENMDLWFGYEITHEGGTTPAGCDDGPAVMGRGDLIMLDSVWFSAGSTYGLDFNWNLAGHIEFAGKNSGKILTKSEVINTGTSDLVNVKTTRLEKKFYPNPDKGFLGYNVYKDGELFDFTTDEIYTDYYMDPMGYEYCVSALYDGGESECSNEIFVAMTIGIEEKNEPSIQISPNPAEEFIFIRANEKMTVLKAYSSNGQLMQTIDVEAKEFRLNTSDWESGIYYLTALFEEYIWRGKVVVK